MMLNWISEAEKLPVIGQSILLMTPRQSGQWWDTKVAQILVRHEDVIPNPVIARNSSWPTEYWWASGERYSDTTLITGNGYWASMEDLPLPPGAVPYFEGDYHAVKQIGECFITKGPTLTEAE
ncbi:MAG: hypothetical protein JKY34_11305 [Kordiimonadaceae bacterium]|nr:hypothetical protein [Kordiimonadaceae bacterium]